MNALDLYLIIPVIVGFIIGLFRGLIKEIISLLVIVLGIYLSRMFSGVMAGLLVNILDISAQAAQPLAFLMIFVIIAILLSLLAKLLHRVVNVLSLGLLNSLAGAFFGGLKLLLIISLFLNLAAGLEDKVSIIEPETKVNSFFYEPFLRFAPELWEDITDQKAPGHVTV
jgi:membrane protein required for colicin V production